MMSTNNTVDRNAHPARNPNTISIWQQNVNRSSTCQHALISSAALARRGIDIVALQEPPINNFGTTTITREWTAVYPSTHNTEPTKTRSLLLLRSNILTDRWKQVDFPSGDVTVITIRGDWGDLTIYNIYNDCEENTTIHQLEAFAHARSTSELTQPMLWLGDFNRHHLHWDDPADTRLFTRSAIQNAEILISVVAELGLDMALPQGIPTHLHNVSKKWSRLDQVFISEDYIETILICEALADEPGINTDHLPILTSLDLNLARAPSNPPRNFRNVDWEEFEKTLSAKLDGLPPPLDIKSTGELNMACSKLTEAIQETIAEKVPSTKVGIKAKRWWTKELKKLRQTANNKGRKASKYRDWPEHQSHVERREANKTFQKTLERTKRQHWRDWLEKADDPDIWTAHRYASSPPGDGGKSRIPVLKLTRDGQESVATTNEEKSTMLATAFFPPKPPDEEPLHFVYPEPICKMNHIARDQIKRRLAKLKPYKAPGPDGIPNIVLTKCADILTDRLYHIYKAITNLGIYYDPWKLSTTVVLRKPGKPRYDTPKAYRPIALLNTLCKVLTALMAELMTFYTEAHQLLPAHHFGGRPGRTTSDAVHLLVHKIKDTWRKRQVTAVLFLDIEGAFPNAVTSRLLHSMRKRRLPEKLIAFAEMMLKNRYTTLRFDDYTSETVTLDNGIGQGDPLSMALYQYYNADILEIPHKPQESAEAYVDDAILTASAKSFEEAHEMLAEMMTRTGGMVEWSKSHNSSIEYSKLALIDFSHHGVKKERPPLVLPDVTVPPSPNAKYLGIILDQHLNWGPQLAQVRGKGAKWASQIRRLARPSWGLTPKAAKKLFVSVALPRILYGIDIWCTPLHGSNAKGGKKGSVNFVKKLITVQRAGSLAITGGFRTSPTDSLDAHAALLPMELRVEKACHNAITRIAALPREHPLHALVKRSAKGRVKRHQSPLHKLTSIFGIDPSAVEKIPPVRMHPSRKSSQPVFVDIPPNKDASKRADANAVEKIKVYSDGSAHDGKVGAAAILRREGKPDRSLQLYLGTTEQHTVYEAELVGMLMGLHLIKTERQSTVKCVLNVDNQAALVAIRMEMTKSGQHLAANILQLVKQLHKSKGSNRFRLTFRWSAGHVGIEGNEDADELAKEAADGKSSDKGDLPPCLRKKIGFSVSAMRQAKNDRLKRRWTTSWTSSPRYQRSRFQDLLTPYSQKYLKYISSDQISRKTASLIFQLRVGHAPINQYLYRFKKVDSPQCPACGHPKESAEHFLLHCPKYAHERWPLLRNAGSRLPTITKLLSSHKLLRPLASYIEATERFKEEPATNAVSATIN